MPHLNDKQNKDTNPVISSQDYHLTQPCLSEEKQTNKQKLSTNLTLHETHKPLDQHLEGRNQKEKRIQPSSRKEFNFSWSLGKGDLKYNKLKEKKNNEKAEKYYTNEETN